MTVDSIKGALLGTAVGDALGMPVEGLSHQNVRMYYKGIKGYTADEKRGDLTAGQWTDDTQFTFALVRVLTASADPVELPARVAGAYLALRPEARRWGPTSRAAIDRLAGGAAWDAAGDAAVPTNGAAMRAAPLGVWWAVAGASREQAFRFIQPILKITHRHPASVAAGFGQAFVVREALRHTPATFDAGAFWAALIETTAWAEAQAGADTRVSDRLRELAHARDEFPLDLQDRCNGTGPLADESWPFAAAMFARNPSLIEATLLSAINVGGDADTVGAMVGAALGALHGWQAFPAAWRDGLEDVARLEAEAEALAHALGVF
ncbi:hypothetical protein AWN76_009570 [Rhodothermaceae bacterium RA]|nr:hypothetical protein AWN76_009570 [Rhodothermaceae bacterium RA]